MTTTICIYVYDIYIAFSILTQNYYRHFCAWYSRWPASVASVLKFDPCSAAKGQHMRCFIIMFPIGMARIEGIDPTSGATQYCCDLLVNVGYISYYMPYAYHISLFHPIIPSHPITMFQQYVPSICSINMFHQYVPSLCSITMFHHYVPSLCSINIFHHYVPWI